MSLHRCLSRSCRLALLGLTVLVLAAVLPGEEKRETPSVEFPFREGDRVAWFGSSSTAIGVWPKTMEFLLSTRHPQLKLTYKRATTGGGTFATGLKEYDKLLGDFKPTLVLFNYGGNDAGAGEKGLPTFKTNMEKIVDLVKANGGRSILMTPQAADVRKSGEASAARRTLYAETMIAFAREKGWPVIDTHHPLEALQQAGQKDNDSYTILKDTIHLTEPAYIAWGMFLYERLQPPSAESAANLTADGKVTATKKCQVADIKADKDSLAFTRSDEVLPILPSAPLPPRKHVPLEKLSPYLLQVTDLPEGQYEIRCEGKPIGTVSAKMLAAGVNLNTVLLDAKNPAPWEALAKELWMGKGRDQVGKTKWRFVLSKQ